MPSLTRHPRYPASGIRWGESDAARFRLPRPRSSAEWVESSPQVEPVPRSRWAPRPSWLVVEFMLIMLGAFLLYRYLLAS